MAETKLSSKPQPLNDNNLSFARCSPAWDLAQGKQTTVRGGMGDGIGKDLFYFISIIEMWSQVSPCSHSRSRVACVLIIMRTQGKTDRG